MSVKYYCRSRRASSKIDNYRVNVWVEMILCAMRIPINAGIRNDKSTVVQCFINLGDSRKCTFINEAT